MVKKKIYTYPEGVLLEFHLPKTMSRMSEDTLQKMSKISDHVCGVSEVSAHPYPSFSTQCFTATAAACCENKLKISRRCDNFENQYQDCYSYP